MVSSENWTNTSSKANDANKQAGPGQSGGGMDSGTTLYDLAPEKSNK